MRWVCRMAWVLVLAAAPSTGNDGRPKRGPVLPDLAPNKECSFGTLEARKALLKGKAFLLAIGMQPRNAGLQRDPESRLRIVSIGNRSDPATEAFVRDFNAEMLRAHAQWLEVRSRPKTRSSFERLSCSLRWSGFAEPIAGDEGRLAVDALGTGWIDPGVRFFVTTGPEFPEATRIALIEVDRGGMNSCEAHVRKRFLPDLGLRRLRTVWNPLFAVSGTRRVYVEGVFPGLEPHVIRAGIRRQGGDPVAELDEATDVLVLGRMPDERLAELLILAVERDLVLVSEETLRLLIE